MFAAVLMTRLHLLPHSLQKSLNQHSLLKVISGLNNFEADSVICIAKAAGAGGADLLDVACQPDLIRLAIEVSGIPVCVSAVEPSLFVEAVKAGASMIEIGNFDSFYLQGRFFSAQEVLSLTIQTRRLIPDLVLSVTVPHILPLDQQAQLSIDLVKAGADLIQTEGGTSANPLSPGVLGLVEKAAPTLASTHIISQTLRKENLSIPVISASGLSTVTAPMAVAAGAAGVGIGSAINRLNEELAMVAAVRTLCEVMHSHQTSSAEVSL